MKGCKQLHRDRSWKSMGRTPCCEKLGVKKGPWSEEEDQILIAFIHKNGHGNWRSLPKRAGLPRCGKSCRLRWTNYLRPDIKRGNFTPEEEDTIIRLHETLGNKWSAIASELPGRTDNEIKNIWHTHLKKRLLCSSSTLSNTTSNTTTSMSSEICVAGEGELQMRRDLSFSETDLSLVPNFDESIWSEEFTVPLFLDEEVKDDDDDMEQFWMSMLVEAGSYAQWH